MTYLSVCARVVVIVLCTMTVPSFSADAFSTHKLSGNPDEMVRLLSDQDPIMAESAKSSTPESKEKTHADDNFRKHQWFTWCARTGNNTELQALIASGTINLDQLDSTGSSALHWATRGGHEETVTLLLGSKADPNVCSHVKRNTALMLVAGRNKPTKIAQLLLDQKADPNICNKTRASALMVAASKGRADLIALLLTSGAQVKHCDKSGRAALHYVNHDARGDCMQLLLAAKADVYAESLSGKTALYYCGNMAGVTALVRAGAIITPGIMQQTKKWVSQSTREDKPRRQEVYDFLRHMYQEPVMPEKTAQKPPERSSDRKTTEKCVIM